MSTVYPGTTVETTVLTPASSKALFDGIFATGGITLSQLSLMTGLEPYLIQNWVKRGFVSPPQKRVYSREQFSRIVIINMLREALQIERICNLIHLIGGDPKNPNDDLISNEELYHRYVHMLSDPTVNTADRATVQAAAERAASDFEGSFPEARRQLVSILSVMLYAHAAAKLRTEAELTLKALI